MLGVCRRLLGRRMRYARPVASRFAAARGWRCFSGEGKLETNPTEYEHDETSASITPGLSIKGTFNEGAPVYLDFQATTPVDPRVLDRMMPFMVGSFGNPHSKTHSYGWETESEVEQARKHVADLINADPREIVFTSGATESNNQILKGVANFYRKRGNHIITTQTEHKCVLDSCRVLQQNGFEVTYLPVKSNGLVDIDQFREAIRPETILCSVMYVNNEIGVVQPVKEIARICRENKIFFHTDAAQAVGKVPVDVKEDPIDVMSISGHKIYGPKGIGAMYVRRRPRVRIDPLISGGGQERGMRSGTLAPALVVGFGEACRLANEELDVDTAHVSRLGEKLLNGLRDNCSHIHLNGDEFQRYPGNINVSFAYVEGESLLMALKDIAVSSGSACTSASLEPSYVLRALGVEEDLAHGSLRFGVGRFTTEEEVDHAIQLCSKHVLRLREMSPLWEMVQEGIDLSTIKWTG